MDDVDLTSQRQETLDALGLAAVRRIVADITKGHEGECDKCGNHSPRLMGAAYFKKFGRASDAADISDGICPPCRDKLRLP